MSEILKKILNDIKIELSDEFDRNFERKAFFSKPWPKRKHEGKGSLLVQTGKLRRSLRSQISGTSVIFSSSEPYAAIHNEGGTITVTRKMRRYFWAKYYELSGKIRYRKDGAASKASARTNASAEYYRNLALMRVGSKITIPQRRFIGDAPEVRKIAEEIINDNMMSSVQKEIKNRLKSNEK